MKFSFVNPSLYDEISGKKGGYSTWPPLGILYLATYLRGMGVEVSVLDQAAKGYDVSNTVEWIIRENPDIVGFSTLSTNGRTAALLSNEVKKINPNILVVYGGYFATFNAARIFNKYPSVDVIVRGEGENTVLDLVNCFENESKLKNVRGITYRSGKGIISTPDRPLIIDLDSLPFPDRKLLDQEYQSNIAGIEMSNKKFTCIISSRGCVHRCRFCNCQKIARNIWRPRSVDNTLRELRLLVSEGYEQFMFVDDSFTLNQNRVIDLCRKMREEKMGVYWACEGRVDSCSYEMFREMAQAGCKILFFGIESANQRILDYYNKRITPQQSRKAVETARKAGIDIIIGSFIVGGPNETREEVNNTLTFARKLPIDFPQFNVLGINPGMDIWEELKNEGFLNEEDHWEDGVKVANIHPNAVPLQELGLMIQDAFKDFFRSSNYLFQQAVRTMKSPYRMGIAKNNLGRLNFIKHEYHEIYDRANMFHNCKGEKR